MALLLKEFNPKFIPDGLSMSILLLWILKALHDTNGNVLVLKKLFYIYKIPKAYRLYMKIPIIVIRRKMPQLNLILKITLPLQRLKSPFNSMRGINKTRCNSNVD